MCASLASICATVICSSMRAARLQRTISKAANLDSFGDFGANHPKRRFVFCSERGGPLTSRAVHHIVKRAGEEAGIAFSIHPHMLRHARGFLLAQKGTDTRAIQGYLGHRDIKSTVAYTELDPSRFKGLEAD